MECAKTLHPPARTRFVINILEILTSWCLIFNDFCSLRSSVQQEGTSSFQYKSQFRRRLHRTRRLPGFARTRRETRANRVCRYSQQVRPSLQSIQNTPCVTSHLLRFSFRRTTVFQRVFFVLCTFSRRNVICCWQEKTSTWLAESRCVLTDSKLIWHRTCFSFTFLNERFFFWLDQERSSKRSDGWSCETKDQLWQLGQCCSQVCSINVTENT